MILHHRFSVALSLTMVASLFSTCVNADQHDLFYKGRTIDFVIGYAPGSGYDTCARLLARFFGRHIPGTPTVVPKNMPIAGSLAAANHVYRATADGTVIGSISRSLPLAPLLQTADVKSIQFDPRKFTWIGSMSSETTIGFVSSETGINTFDDLKRRQVTTGTAATTSDGFLFSNMINKLFDTKLKIVLGYPGTNLVYTAVERGELDGYFGGTLGSLISTHPDWLSNGSINMIVQIALKKDAALPNVPLIMDYARDETQREALKLILSPQRMGRPYMAPPGLPVGRSETLRTAFDDAMKDPDLIELAIRSSIDISPMTGAEISALLDELYSTSSTAVSIARDALAQP